MSLQYLTFHQWRRRPVRALLTVLSVSIAVTAVLGTSLSQSTVRKALRNMSRKVEGPPALEIVSADGKRFGRDELPDLAGVPGVKRVVPLVCRAAKARADGKRLPTYVIGLESNAEASDWDQLRFTSGRACEGDGEVVMADSIAKGLEIELGTKVTFVGQRIRSAIVVGLADATSMRDLLPEATLAMSAQTLQAWNKIPGQINNARVLLEERADQDEVKRALEELLPNGLVAQSPAGQTLIPGSMLDSIEMALLFAGALSLAMAAFLILNTLRMNFSERRRQLATLRALGSTRGQISWLVINEGLWIGILGTLLGLPGGLALAYVLSESMQRAMKTDLPASAPRWEVLLLALVSAPLVSLLAAYFPARQSRHISAIEESGESEPDRRGRKRLIAFWWACAAGGVALVLMYLVITELFFPLAAIPAFLLLLFAFTASLPELVGPLVRAGNAVLGTVWSVPGRLASEQLLRRPTRTGLTAGVLVIAMCGGLGLGNAILNNVADLQAWYRRTVSGDFLLVDPSASESGKSDIPTQTGDPSTEQELLRELKQQPGVGNLVTFRKIPGRAMETPIICWVRDFPPAADLPWAVDPASEVELRDRLAAGEVVLGSVLAKQLQLGVGDTVRLELTRRAVPLRICGVVIDYNQGGVVAFLDRDAAGRFYELGQPQYYMVERQAGASLLELEATLTGVAKQRGMLVQSFVEIRDELDKLINGIVVALWCLLAIGFLVGGFGVANTLSMSVLEQTRELGMLRIVGMTRSQVRRMIYCEALLLGLVGSLLGSGAGIATALLIHACLQPLLGYSVPFVFHYWLLAANAGGCLLVTLASAWLPSRRATRLDVLEAVAYE